MNNKKIFAILSIFIAVSVFYIVTASAAVDYSVPTVCCEKTKSGLECQNVPQEQCASSNQAPTSCESTSFCKQAYCYNSFDGTCNQAPKITCEDNGGTWSETFPPQCELGCCVLGDQASFTTLTKCKQLSGNLGLETNYKKEIKDEIQCILSVAGQERGACVYDEDFETTCRFTTRDSCQNTIKGSFYKDKLCSADELATNCGPTAKKECIPGRDEVYFVDSCSNPANIYDAGKARDSSYWSNVFDKPESCNPYSNNAGSGSCGNCNYLLGSTCREDGGAASCVDLNCKGNAEQLGGKTERKHGESWCSYKDAGTTGQGESTTGSRFIKTLCNNGEIVSEPCADFRQEECIQDDVEVSDSITFTQAACRVNRWRDCAVQTEQDECEDGDLRDCTWKDLSDTGGVGSVIGNYSSSGACLVKKPPGFEFWEPEGEADEICSIGNAQCNVIYEKSVIGGTKCKQNCYCLQPGWEEERGLICASLGDCGPKENWIGAGGKNRGYSRAIDGVEQYTRTLREVLASFVPSA